MIPRVVIDSERLYLALDAHRETTGLSWRRLAQELDLSPSTLTRLRNQGRLPDVAAYLTLCRLLGVPAETFTSLPVPPEEPPSLPVFLRVALAVRREVPEPWVHLIVQVAEMWEQHRTGQLS